MPQEMLYPVGRLVGGSLYTPRVKTDRAGQPKLGPDGQPQKDFSFGVAFAKGATTHWAQTEWGAKIWAEGHAGFQAIADAPTFAWKVTDGDSAIPNKKGRMPRDNEGWPGHWVVWFSGSFAPKICSANGKQVILDANVVKLGHYVQVSGSVKPNTGDSPGVYLNFGWVAHSGFGPEINLGLDPASVGFGGVLPAGASVVPLAGMAGAPAVPMGAPGGPPVHPVTVPPSYAPPIQPNPAFLMPPVTPVVPPIPAAKQMTAKAGGVTYEAMIGAGWNDEMMRKEGYLI